ncbi:MULTISPECIES: hypothetical protein [Arthrobacter]|uniref:Uncharacterized protein n=1 Tax=Arthrobacter terricola TaxID=2547396 RepID=A0A4R5KQ70_9MICC|nr:MULTISPECIES: hypothetical protein [Arthrobacter]MBT8160977.1 hypothetical protein [Arthrobacter sp. GN70]TDF96840.1 hypothetical protein E1809_08950 [Arthrobacter terricola]
MGSLLDAALFAYGQNPIMGARMIQSSVQAVGANVYSTLGFQNVEFDTSGSAIASTSGTLTANLTGLWSVSGTVSYATTSSHAGYWFSGWITRNSTAGGDVLAVGTTLAYNGAYATSVNVAAVVRLAAGDVLRLQALHNYTPANVNTQALTCFQMAYLGPA